MEQRVNILTAFYLKCTIAEQQLHLFAGLLATMVTWCVGSRPGNIYGHGVYIWTRIEIHPSPRGSGRTAQTSKQAIFILRREVSVRTVELLHRVARRLVLCHQTEATLLRMFVNLAEPWALQTPSSERHHLVGSLIVEDVAETTR